jgi:succinate-semialdehyde dehydrogenase/glutarate-semialdehyde dehydrogenase
MKLKDTSLFREANLIDNAWIDADIGATMNVDNPSTLSSVGTVPSCGEAETLRAIEAAETCFATFRKTTAAHRLALLEKWHALIMDAQDDLATLMTLEQGKPLAESKGQRYGPRGGERCSWGQTLKTLQGFGIM